MTFKAVWKTENFLSQKKGKEKKRKKEVPLKSKYPTLIWKRNKPYFHILN